MRTQAWAFLLVGFAIGFAGLYTWTKKRAPDVVKTLPLPVEALGPAAATARNQPADPGEPPPPPLDTARVEELEREIKANPKNVEPLVELANIYFDQKNFKEAINLYSKAVELQPSNVNVRTDFGTALFYDKRFDDAISQFKKVLDLQPNHPRTLFNMGVALLHGKNDPQGAIQSWEKLVQTNPDFPQNDFVKQQIEALKERVKQP